jgi:hypothetical protein
MGMLNRGSPPVELVTSAIRTTLFRNATRKGARGSTREPAKRTASPIIISAGVSVARAAAGPISAACTAKTAKRAASTRRTKTIPASRTRPCPLRKRTRRNVETVAPRMTLRRSDSEG